MGSYRSSRRDKARKNFLGSAFWKILQEIAQNLLKQDSGSAVPELSVVQADMRIAGIKPEESFGSPVAEPGPV
jgi:hypothetical protein